MITPRFKLDQDENFLYISIHAPFSRVSDADIYMDGTDFRFHSNPYYLRLNLPGDIVENDDAKALFDADTNEFKITCPKAKKGTQFQGLDMLTSLLEPKGKRNVDETTIEVLSDPNQDDPTPPSSKLEPNFDWFVEQQLPEDQDSLLKGDIQYGFGLNHSKVFSKLADELLGVVDIKDPDTLKISERRTHRTEQEDTAFNPEHYLADLFQADNIDHLISFKLAQEAGEDDSWTDQEDEILKNLPNKEFLLDQDVLQSTYLGLVDILLAYTYESRTTMEDMTVESAWTISKLSGTLSWFEVFTNIQQVACCFMRRSLCFPLYRNFKLSQKIVSDAVAILKSGKKSVLHCLLKIYHLFNKSDTRYILNQLYIRDYCVWIQKASEENIKSLGEGLASVKLSKQDVGFNLLGLEEVGQRLMCDTDSSDESDLEDRMAQMSLDNKKNEKSAFDGMPMDMRVAAEAAYMSSSSDSEIDSDDLSSAESD